VIALEAHAEGTILPVRAHAAARRNQVGGEHNGALQVSVTQVPEKGKANQAIVALLAKALALRKSQFELLAGETARDKRFLVRGIAAAELATRIEQVVGST
jgi:uncharacterized protein YggU (UPF0235/DUF167 family)